MIASPPVPMVSCPNCQSPRTESVFCIVCGAFLLDPTGSTYRVTFTRRFFGSSLLEAVLAVATLIIGWFIWFAVRAKEAQTPAKALTNLYVIDLQTGRAVGTGQMWLREIVVKGLVLFAINMMVGIAGIIDAVWVFFDKDRQALHDKVLKQVVVYAPRGLPEHMLHVSGPYVAPGNPLSGMKLGDPPAPSPAVAESLRELQRLHTEGILTDEEYDEKRRSLVDRL